MLMVAQLLYNGLLTKWKNVIKGIEGEERSFNPPFLVWFTNRPLYQGTGSIFPKTENLHP